MFKNTLFAAVWEQCRGWLYVIATLVLLSIGLLVYQTQIVASETEQLQRRMGSLEKQLRNRTAKMEESGVPVSAVEQMEQDLRKFSEMIPEKKKFADFIGDLFYWADQAELDIRQISYQPQIDKETNYLNYGLNFSVQGNYGQIKKFIHLLENSKRILIIDKIALTGKRNKAKFATVNLQINLTTLFQEAAQ